MPDGGAWWGGYVGFYLFCVFLCFFVFFCVFLCFFLCFFVFFFFFVSFGCFFFSTSKRIVWSFFSFFFFFFLFLLLVLVFTTRRGTMVSPDFRINPDREICSRGKNCPDYLNLVHDRNLDGLDHCWKFAHRQKSQAVWCHYSDNCGALRAWRSGNPTPSDIGHMLTYDHPGRCSGFFDFSLFFFVLFCFVFLFVFLLFIFFFSFFFFFFFRSYPIIHPFPFPFYRCLKKPRYDPCPNESPFSCSSQSPIGGPPLFGGWWLWWPSSPSFSSS